MVKFMVFHEGKPLNTYVLDEPVITIGRLPENTISIASMGVSRRHLRIEEDYDRKYILTDLNSLNGSTVNGKRVKKVPLHSGDKITIGKFTIIYEEISPGADATADAGTTGVPTAEQGGAAPSVQQMPPAQPDKRSDTDKPKETAAPVPAEEMAAQGRTQKVPAATDADDDDGEKTPMLIETAKHISYVLDKQYMTLGSGDSDDIPVTGFMISEQQAYLELTEEGWRIGTNKMMGKLKVNGRAIKTGLLRHKDRIDIGSTSFRYMENG
jgi:pSer/pThr/pTyr-binding forkhead associated (FHA) protein